MDSLSQYPLQSHYAEKVTPSLFTPQTKDKLPFLDPSLASRIYCHKTWAQSKPRPCSPVWLEVSTALFNREKLQDVARDHVENQEQKGIMNPILDRFFFFPETTGIQGLYHSLKKQTKAMNSMNNSISFSNCRCMSANVHRLN